MNEAFIFETLENYSVIANYNENELVGSSLTFEYKEGGKESKSELRYNVFEEALAS